MQIQFTSNPTVYLIDDDSAMRDSLSEALKARGYQVLSFSAAPEFLALSAFATPAVIVTDMRMPDMSGVELQGEVNRHPVQIPIIFISGESTVHQSVLAFRQGAIEFLLKPFETNDLLKAIESGMMISLRNYDVSEKKLALEERLSILTPREREVFYLLAQGFNNAELVKKLNIALATAKQYKVEVMRKLELNSLTQLMALKNGFLE